MIDLILHDIQRPLFANVAIGAMAAILAPKVTIGLVRYQVPRVGRAALTVSSPVE